MDEFFDEIVLCEKGYKRLDIEIEVVNIDDDLFNDFCFAEQMGKYFEQMMMRDCDILKFYDFLECLVEIGVGVDFVE
jgi:hypothetical protein